MKNSMIGVMICVWTVVQISVPCFALTIKGVVVNENNSREPITNAIVSVGHTAARTTTNAEGRFSLEISDLAAGKLHRQSKLLRVHYNSTLQLFDFRQAPSINQFSIYRLNGTVVLSTLINPNKRTVQVPVISNGMYLVKFSTEKAQITGTWVKAGNSTTFSHSMPVFSSKRSGAAVSMTLLLRHDDYLPLDFETSGSIGDLQIGMQPDPRAYVFDPSQVHSYHFTVSHEDSLSMEKDALLENYIPAEMQFNGTSYGTVGLRYKGSIYSLPNCFDSAGNRADKEVCRKISLKVKFNKYVDTTRLYKMKALNLHSMSADESKMHDMLAYEMYRKMGIYSPRTAYVKVFINGAFEGLFLAVECIDGRFTKSRWPEYGDGNLYKEAWPRNAVSSYYHSHLETNNDPEDNPDVSGMIGFYNAINSSTPGTFEQTISSFIDLDYWVRYIAVDRAIQNWDGIMAWYGSSTSNAGNHNYFIYEEESPGGKFWIIPWDLDNTFWRNDPFIEDADIPNWNETPSSCEPMLVWGNTPVIPPACDKFTSLLATTQWNSFVKKGEEFLATWFRPDILISRINSYAQIISDVLEIDPIIEKAGWEKRVETLKRDVVTLNKKFDDYIHGRVQETDTSDYSEPFTGSGYLVIDRTNNFEFTPAATVSFAYTYASTGTLTEVIHNTVNPLWGTADLLYKFQYNPIQDASSYSEWAGVGVRFSNLTDLTGLKEIHINMKSDSQRYMWLYITSPIYQNYDVSTEYGWTDFYVGTSNKIYILDLSDIAYPSWANSSNPEILDHVLTSVSGIGFGPNARFDAAGELSVVPDIGYLAIDNIRFIFE